MAGGHHDRGTVLKGCGTREVEDLLVLLTLIFILT